MFLPEHCTRCLINFMWLSPVLVDRAQTGWWRDRKGEIKNYCFLSPKRSGCLNAHLYAASPFTSKVKNIDMEIEK
ncbi:Extracellular Matrix Protein Fras1 [Manis pentadactyla]|nr:Extracellular Matrix Protein Fras1 [Manis pentadactyla]